MKRTLKIENGCVTKTTYNKNSLTEIKIPFKANSKKSQIQDIIDSLGDLRIK